MSIAVQGAEQNLARLKQNFPAVFEMLSDAEGKWLGLDDYTPFWQTRRILQDRSRATDKYKQKQTKTC